MPKKVGAAAVSLAGKLDDRTAPYTVPMKVVPRQCGTAGTRPSSTAASVLGRGVHGGSRAPVPVCALSRPGRVVQPLRPRQPLLRPAVLASGARGRSARERTSIPTVLARPACARRAVAAVARTLPCSRCGWRLRRRRWSSAERDAPGLPARGGCGSTGRMDTPHHLGARACAHGDHHPDGRNDHRNHHTLAVPALCQAAARLGAPGLPAPWPAPRASKVAP